MKTHCPITLEVQNDNFILVRCTKYVCITDNAQQMMPQMVQPFLPMQEAMAAVTDTSQPPPHTGAMPTGNPLAMVPPFSLPRKSVA